MKFDTDALTTPTSSHWQAQLALGFDNDAGTTRLVDRRHSGPLRVQKALYPEHPSVCHVVILHPPGGVVGGDQLSIAVRVGAVSAALIATPGAAKWYRANGRPSRQKLALEVHAGASLEWLPQETIFYNGAQVLIETTITLHGDAQWIGIDIQCFGRTASGEQFDHGIIRQRTTLRRDGKLLWLEQACIDGAAEMMQSPLGLAGHTVSATLLASALTLPAALLTTLRAQFGSEVGISQIKTLLVVRYLGDSSETARQLMLRAWHIIRPLLLGRDAVVPRIWQT